MSESSEGSSLGFVPRLCLFIARFCTSAWIGAAALFVFVGIKEVSHADFDTTTKDSLVAIRFPAFYAFGFALIGIAWIGTCLAGNSRELPKRRRIACLGLLAGVLLLMTADYVLIYQPLLRMVTPPGQTKAASFHDYHQMSKWINMAGLGVNLVAAVLLNWPVNRNATDPRKHPAD